MSFKDMFDAMNDALAALYEREEMGAYGEDFGYNRPQKGNLSNYGKDPQHARAVRFEAGDGSEGAPQTYVLMQIEFSYDTPRPDSDGALRRECGAAIRRAVEAKLTGEGLAAQLGDATLTLRTMVMRQEDDPAKLGTPVSMSVAPADPRAGYGPGGHEPMPEGEPYPDDPYDSMNGGVRNADEWSADIPPNAGSAS